VLTFQEVYCRCAQAAATISSRIRDFSWPDAITWSVSPGLSSVLVSATTVLAPHQPQRGFWVTPFEAGAMLSLFHPQEAGMLTVPEWMATAILSTAQESTRDTLANHVDGRLHVPNGSLDSVLANTMLIISRCEICIGVTSATGENAADFGHLGQLWKAVNSKSKESEPVAVTRIAVVHKHVDPSSVPVVEKRTPGCCFYLAPNTKAHRCHLCQHEAVNEQQRKSRKAAQKDGGSPSEAAEGPPDKPVVISVRGIGDITISSKVAAKTTRLSLLNDVRTL